MRRDDVEQSIAGLGEQLRDALLLSTEYTFAESAERLNITREQLVQRVAEAKRRVITELLGNWQDSESMFLVDMHIDAVAMEMQRRRMGVLYRMRKWLQSVGQTVAGLVEAIGKLPQGRQVSVPTGAVATIALVVVAVYLYPAMNDNNDLPKEVRAQQEIVFWQSIDDSRNPADYQAYLHRWPAGIYADLARERLARPAPMSRTEAAEFEREASFGSGSPPSEPSATVILARALTTLRLLSDSALWVCDDRPDGTSQVQVRWQETCRGEMEERRRRLERRHEALEDVVRALANWRSRRDQEWPVELEEQRLKLEERRLELREQRLELEERRLELREQRLELEGERMRIERSFWRKQRDLDYERVFGEHVASWDEEYRQPSDEHSLGIEEYGKQMKSDYVCGMLAMSPSLATIWTDFCA